MAGVECPKCGRLTGDGAIICPGCDFILDASFLGDDITDDERDRRPRKKASRTKPSAPPRIDFGEDAMILGNLDDDEVSSFKSRDAGLSQREVTQTRFYIGGTVAQLMEAHAIPEVAAGVAGASIRMTPFERHVLGFVNGRRSIGRIQKKSAMEESEFKTAIAMLADKGFLRLKGWKKPRAAGAGTGAMTGPSMTGPSMTGSMVRPPPAREPERTVVASMAHIEAAAGRAEAKRHSSRPALRGARGPVPEPVSAIDTPPAPMPVAFAAATELGRQMGEVVTRVVEHPTVSRPAAVPNRRFASLRAEVPPASERSAAGSAAGIAPTDKPDGVENDIDAGDVWSADDHQSSVFSDSGAAPKPRRSPSLADVDADIDGAPDLDNVDDFADAFASAQTGALEAFRDPTGLGDGRVAEAPAGSDGAPVGDDDDDDDDDDPPFASAEAVREEAEGDTSGREHHDDADKGGRGAAHVGYVPGAQDELVGPTDRDIVATLSSPHRVHDEVTAMPMRREASLADRPDWFVGDPDGFDDALPAQATGHHVRPMTLPSSAMQPVVVDLPPVPAAPPAPSRASPAPANVGPPMALPGQTILKPGDAGFAPLPAPASPLPAASPTKKPAVSTTRVSATSQVPFELRKKAERIYEQALKDQLEGRISSAMMNARLAMNFDPTVDAYRELHDDLARQKSGPKGGPRPQELVLFEQASEAEGKGDYLKAVALLEQAIAISPRAGALYNRLGVVLSIRLKRHEEALAHLKKAIELEPGSLVYMNNFSKVTGLLESVIERGPRKKEKGGLKDEPIAVKKIRPKMF